MIGRKMLSKAASSGCCCEQRHNAMLKRHPQPMASAFVESQIPADGPHLLRASQETEADMRRSIFCVCPPGNTQDSARVWRAIIFGCIPVTFFR